MEDTTMLDFDLSKMALIGVVALIVLGPERLPRVARTAGALFGRAQRYADELKTQVSREMELDELRRMKTQFESTVGRFEDAIDSNRRVQSEALSALTTPATPIAITGEGTRAIGMGSGSTSGTASEKAPANLAGRRNLRAIRAGLRNGNRAPDGGSPMMPLRKARSGGLGRATRSQPVRFL
jgi:sec-independent protein translocase protein TatB